MKQPSVSQLYKLCKEELKLMDSLGNLRDSRARPATGFPSIARAILLAPIFGYESLQDVDLFSRSREARKLGVAQVSDSLIQKALPGVSLKPLNDLLQMMYIQSQQRGLCKVKLSNPAKPLVKVAHIDGTQWMTHNWVFAALAGVVSQVLRMRWMANIGEELKEAQKLLFELIRELGPGFCDIVTFDGKHVDFGFLRQLPNYGSDYFIRLRGDDGRNLKIVAQIEAGAAKGNCCYEGIDYERGCSFKVWRVEDIQEDRLGHQVVGVKIVLFFLKGAHKGKTETHYAFTSAVYLNEEDLYEVRKGHWDIETLFRTLKRQFWARHSYMKYPHEAGVLARLICLSLNIYELYRWYESQRIREPLGFAWTHKQVRLMLYRSLILWQAGVTKPN